MPGCFLHFIDRLVLNSANSSCSRTLSMMQAVFNALRQKNLSLVRSLVKFDKMNIDYKYPKVVGGRRALHNVDDEDVTEEVFIRGYSSEEPITCERNCQTEPNISWLGTTQRRRTNRLCIWLHPWDLLKSLKFLLKRVVLVCDLWINLVKLLSM